MHVIFASCMCILFLIPRKNSVVRTYILTISDDGQGHNFQGFFFFFFVCFFVCVGGGGVGGGNKPFKLSYTNF